MKLSFRKAPIMLLFIGFVVSIAGCTPEPEDAFGQPNKTGEELLDSSWPAEAANEDSRTTEFPADFPTAWFTVPKSAEILDVGSRVSDTWFIVISTETKADAISFYEETISINSLEPVSEEQTIEGNTDATLISEQLHVHIINVEHPDGTILINIELSKIDS